MQTNITAASPVEMHTVAEAAAIAGISKRYMEIRIAEGTGPDVTRIGRRVLIRDDRLGAWIDQLTEQPEAQMGHDEQNHAALTVLAGVKANIIDREPDLMVKTLRGSSRDVSLRLVEAVNIICHLCRLSGQPEAALAALIEDVARD